MLAAVRDSILGISRLGIRHGRDKLPKRAQELVDWNLVNRDAENWARQYTYNLVSDTVGTLRKQLQAEIPLWVASGKPLSTLITTISGLVGDPARGELIASTEATRVYAEANERTWVAVGVAPTPKADPKSDLVTKPPAHPRCRCYPMPKRMPDGTTVIVWYTVRDERVCVTPLKVTWQTEKILGCRGLHRRVISQGPYMGRKV